MTKTQGWARGVSQKEVRFPPTCRLGYKKGCSSKVLAFDTDEFEKLRKQLSTACNQGYKEACKYYSKLSK